MRKWAPLLQKHPASFQQPILENPNVYLHVSGCDPFEKCSSKAIGDFIRSTGHRYKELVLNVDVMLRITDGMHVGRLDGIFCRSGAYTPGGNAA